MKKLKLRLYHWLCEGIYVRTKSTYSSMKEKYPQLQAGYAFKAELSWDDVRTDYSCFIDADKCKHELKNVRPSTKEERIKFNTMNQYSKPVKVA